MAKSIQNNLFKIDLLEDGTFNLLDKRRGSLWSSDPWGDGAGILTIIENNSNEKRSLFLSKTDDIKIKISSNKASISFKWKDGIQVNIELKLAESGLYITVCEVKLPEKYRFLELIYPLRFASLEVYEDGYAALPYSSGIIIPTRKYTRIGGEFFRMDDSYFIPGRWGGRMEFFSSLKMNWYGVQHDNAGLCFIIEDPFDAGIDFIANTHTNRYDMIKGKMVMKKRITAISPVWEASLGSFSYKRRILLIPCGSKGYVEMANIYRDWAKNKGWFRTLKEKIKSNPEREKLIGSVHIDLYGGYPHYIKYEPNDFNFKQIDEMIISLKQELKLERVMLVIWGTFENNPPECWPINKERGGKEIYKKAIDHAKRFGYLISSYHAYSPNLDNGTVFCPEHSYQVSPDNEDVLTYRWARTCSSYYLEYARRNLRKELKSVGQNADYTDCLSNRGRECYSKKHKHKGYLSRKQSIENRVGIFKFIHEELNLPSSTEHGSSFLIPYVDSLNDLSYLPPNFGMIAILVPLFQLVFHDCVITRRHPGFNYRNKGSDQFPEQVLLDLVFGNASLHSFQMWEFEGRKRDLSSIDNLIGQLHRDIGTERLIDYSFLDDNYLVQYSEFGNGTKVYANNSLNEYKGEVDLPPYGYYIKFSDGRVLKGRIRTEIEE